MQRTRHECSGTAWFRLTQKAGRTIPIEIWRNGRREKLRLKVVD